MTRTLLLAAIGLLGASSLAQAQVPPTNFDQAAYISCREAHNMQPEPRKILAVYLAEHSARHHGVIIPDDERGGQLALLVPRGSTLSPAPSLFTLITRPPLPDTA